jgi:hypothetical protein
MNQDGVIARAVKMALLSATLGLRVAPTVSDVPVASTGPANEYPLDVPANFDASPVKIPL